MGTIIQSTTNTKEKGEGKRLKIELVTGDKAEGRNREIQSSPGNLHAEAP